MVGVEWIIATAFQCAVHPSNRNMFYTQGEACKTLLEKLLLDGFDADHANFKGVAVLERPDTERDATYTSFMEHNLKKSREDSLLNGTYESTDEVKYGLLSHCHLLNVCRAVLKSLKWCMNEDPTGIRYCDRQGRLSIAALAEHPNSRPLTCQG